jgi:Catalase
MIEEDQEFNFDFDILDPTKLWPEELIPVKIIGKMTLNKNVDNFFAETEQVAFCPANVVPGIDFSNDPLLQGRLFSYEDTQLPVWAARTFREIPINRPVAPVHNNQRDGMHRMAIHPGPVSYFPNSLAQNSPSPVTEEEGGFAHYPQRIDAHVVRARSDSFRDHFSQATLFWNSMSAVEKAHIVDAFHFEVGSVKDVAIKQRVVDMFANVAHELAVQIAAGIGVNPPAQTMPNGMQAASPALSQDNTVKTAKTRKVAILVENGFCPVSVQNMMDALKAAGAAAETVSSSLSAVTAKDGTQLKPNKDLTTAGALVYDAVYVPGGSDHINALKLNQDARSFINEALHHAKTIAASDEAVELLQATDAAAFLPDLTDAQNAPQVLQGIVVVKGLSKLQPFCTEFIDQLAMHRHWSRVEPR